MLIAYLEYFNSFKTIFEQVVMYCKSIFSHVMVPGDCSSSISPVSYLSFDEISNGSWNQIIGVVSRARLCVGSQKTVRSLLHTFRDHCQNVGRANQIASRILWRNKQQLIAFFLTFFSKWRIKTCIWQSFWAPWVDVSCAIVHSSHTHWQKTAILEKMACTHC